MQKKQLLKQAIFDFGTVQIIDNIVIAEINEGVIFDEEQNKQMLEFCSNVLGERSYGYISHRKNSYTVNPTVYLQSSKISNMEAIAIVSSNPSNKLSVSVEKMFFKNPFESFDTIDQAKNWMHNILN
ncbi:hypothetical protein EAX61_08105 [Dokdonia sinensis]|uniref:STAS/SEC14 domain-containing protein n=1 Tax=Dokdonia sinensis TaxID=2479847 RepID=A0A3M0G619_9FLAO|nr:hypothetical protein [Dokdonia sinensis]RMB59537.1 hypothetical protein EAX61_08105 [Dokdonia sinensis]